MASSIILYGTYVGPVPNPPADGAASTGQSASDLPLVYITSSGGTGVNALIPCTVTYSGLAPGFAGLWQINVQIPTNAQSGSAVVLKLFEQDIPNLDQSSSLTCHHSRPTNAWATTTAPRIAAAHSPREPGRGQTA